MTSFMHERGRSLTPMIITVTNIIIERTPSIDISTEYVQEVRIAYVYSISIECIVFDIVGNK